MILVLETSQVAVCSEPLLLLEDQAIGERLLELRNKCLCWTWISWPTKSEEAWKYNANLVMSNFMDKYGR